MEDAVRELREFGRRGRIFSEIKKVSSGKMSIKILLIG